MPANLCDCVLDCIDPVLDNILTEGPGGGLYVPPTIVNAGDGITVTGDGHPATPYIVSALISSDAGNDLSFGSDDGLYISFGDIYASDVIFDPDACAIFTSDNVQGAMNELCAFILSASTHPPASSGTPTHISVDGLTQVVSFLGITGRQYEFAGRGLDTNQLELALPFVSVTNDFVLQAVPGGYVSVDVVFGTIFYDTDGIVTGPTTFTVPVDGVYTYDANIYYAGVGGEFSQARVVRNGVTELGRDQHTLTADLPFDNLNVQGLVELSAGDVLTVDTLLSAPLNIQFAGFKLLLQRRL